MLNQLIESLPQRRPLGTRFSGTMLSLLGHGMVMALAIVATRRSGSVVDETSRDAGTIFFVDDPRPQEPPVSVIPNPPLSWGISFPATTPVTIPPLDSSAPWDSVWFGRYRTVLDSTVIASVASSTAVRAIDEAKVDERPELVSASPPAYPDLLRQAGVEGTVVIEAIIDTSGRVEVGSLRVLQSGNRGFESAAREAVLKAVYRPARIRGQPVRVLVQVPITFTIRR